MILLKSEKDKQAVYLRKYAIKKNIYAIKIEWTGTDTQTNKTVLYGNKFLCTVTAFSGPAPHL